MKNTIRVIAAIAVLLVAGEVYSQAPAPPFSLKLDVSPSSAKAGSNFVVEVDLTNNTKKEIGIQVCLGVTVECNFKIDVRDSHGNSAPEIESQTPTVFSVAGKGVAAGETIKFFSDRLSTFFDLSRPGTYTAKVSRNNDEALVVSNPVTFTVEPNPQIVPTGPFSLKLDVSPSNAKAGSNFVVEVDLTNTTNKRIGLDVCLGMRVECNFDIDVRDSSGNAALETRYLKAVRGKPTGPPLLVSAPSIAGKSVEPGETIRFVSDLPELFYLWRPGTYTVQVARSDNDAVVKSSLVTFTVEPNPQVVAPPEPCSTSADIIVTVSDPSGATIPNALVVVRQEGAGADATRLKVLKTGANGATRATPLPCNAAVDVLVAADGLTPYTRKVWTNENVTSLSVVLKPAFFGPY
jgi:hypothetical protein